VIWVSEVSRGDERARKGRETGPNHTRGEACVGCRRAQARPGGEMSGSEPPSERV